MLKRLSYCVVIPNWPTRSTPSCWVWECLRGVNVCPGWSRLANTSHLLSPSANSAALETRHLRLFYSAQKGHGVLYLHGDSLLRHMPRYCPLDGAQEGGISTAQFENNGRAVKGRRRPTGERVWRYRPKPRGSGKIEHSAPAQELETRKQHLSVPGEVISYKNHQQKHRKTMLCGQEDNKSPVTMDGTSEDNGFKAYSFCLVFVLIICAFVCLLSYLCFPETVMFLRGLCCTR